MYQICLELIEDKEELLGRELRPEGDSCALRPFNLVPSE